MGDRCTGHCCKRFPIPFDLDTVIAKQHELRDGEFLAAMLIPLDDDQRPHMCSDFPYRNPCEHAECTWDDARAGNAPRLETASKRLAVVQ